MNDSLSGTELTVLDHVRKSSAPVQVHDYDTGDGRFLNEWLSPPNGMDEGEYVTTLEDLSSKGYLIHKNEHCPGGPGGYEYTDTYTVSEKGISVVEVADDDKSSTAYPNQILGGNAEYRSPSAAPTGLDESKQRIKKNAQRALPATKDELAVDKVYNKSESARSLKAFLCHSSGDKPIVRDLCKRLIAEGVAPWLDEEKLLPGQDWHQEITKAVRSSDIVIICLSRASIGKAGYVQKEIRYALDIADEQPEGSIFLIPLKLEDCDMPERLRRWQSVTLTERAGFEQLLLAMRVRAESLGIDFVDSDRDLKINLQERVVIVANRCVKLTERELFIYTLFAFMRKSGSGHDGFVFTAEINREDLQRVFRLITAFRGEGISLADCECIPSFKFIDMMAKQADSQHPTDQDDFIRTFIETRSKINFKLQKAGIPEYFWIASGVPRSSCYGLRVLPEKIIWL